MPKVGASWEERGALLPVCSGWRRRGRGALRSLLTPAPMAQVAHCAQPQGWVTAERREPPPPSSLRQLGTTESQRGREIPGVASFCSGSPRSPRADPEGQKRQSRGILGDSSPPIGFAERARAGKAWPAWPACLRSLS